MISHESRMYDLRMRLAVRLANKISKDLKPHKYSESQLTLIFDALADGLGGRTEDELLSLVDQEEGT